MTATAWREKYAREPRPWRPGAAPALDALRLPPGARVLESGAGGGKTAQEAAVRGWNVVAYDHVREGLPAGGIVADAGALPFRDGTFDAVLLIHLLGHLPAAARPAAAREALRVLRPGGVVLAEVFGRGDARAGSGAETEPHTRTRAGIPTHYFLPDEVAALLPGWEVAVERVRRRWGTREIVRAGPGVKQA